MRTSWPGQTVPSAGVGRTRLPRAIPGGKTARSSLQRPFVSVQVGGVEHRRACRSDCLYLLHPAGGSRRSSPDVWPIRDGPQMSGIGSQQPPESSTSRRLGHRTVRSDPRRSESRPSPPPTDRLLRLRDRSTRSC
jgi:hypothetical protein